MEVNKWLLIAIACFCPPLSVFLCDGAGKSLLVNIFFCCCIWFPGFLHAMHIIGKTKFQDNIEFHGDEEKA